MNEIILVSKSPEGDETKEESDVNDSTGDGKNVFDVLMEQRKTVTFKIQHKSGSGPKHQAMPG